ncbi:A disintegrin and metalloproteinase with thrombospondin motifs 9-like isoform X2 [Saccostrea cucullata]|uniref:A disintegrin and metalloproteinase with thrombospondin motifs 9-like isoform X2 n=1 Tax=Saccostrea cuccullata TaxID=36930 RepID=UPI002ED22A0D
MDGFQDLMRRESCKLSTKHCVFVSILGFLLVLGLGIFTSSLAYLHKYDRDRVNPSSEMLKESVSGDFTTQGIVTERMIQMPQTCSDIAGCSRIAKDGEYWLYPAVTNGKRVKIYCHDMQTNPKEYVTLKYENSFVQHDNSNWLSKYKRCTSTFRPPLKKAVFLKVAINIKDMSVNGKDYTFAVRTGNFSLSFGQTADCAGERWIKNCSRFSRAKINTHGTGMIFDPTLVFGKAGGWETDILDFQRSADGAEMSFRCRGWCGWCGPIEEKMKFILTSEAGEASKLVGESDK